MKYSDFAKCCKIANDSVIYGENIMDCANINIVKYQDGANGPIKESVHFALQFADADICIAVTLKGDQSNES